MSELSLENILEGTEPEATEETEAQVEVEAEAEEEAKGEEADSQETDEKAEEDETPSSEEQGKEDQWTKTAVLDERRKRQEREQRIAELEAQIKAKDQQETVSRPDVLEDPDGAFSHTEQQISKQIQGVRLEMSQSLMRELKNDYDELEGEFIAMAETNPVLAQQLHQSNNPAKFAYETALKARQAAELQDVDAYKAKLEAEARAKVEAEFKQEMEEKKAKQEEKDNALMPSLASAQPKGALDTKAAIELEDILSD